LHFKIIISEDSTFHCHCSFKSAELEWQFFDLPDFGSVRRDATIGLEKLVSLKREVGIESLGCWEL
jgi:hypothetical protein